MAATLAIAGTDTGVGKTVVTAALAAYWQHYHPTRSLGIHKPIQSGEGDREYFQRTFSLTQTLAEITPLYFETPVAPAIAAPREGKAIDLGKVWQQLQALQSQKDLLLVEGLGGLGSPIACDYTIADLWADWHLDVILVAPIRLGTIGQLVANTALARLKRLHLKGIILNAQTPAAMSEIADLSPIDLIENLTSYPVLGALPYCPDLGDRETLARAAAALCLEKIWDRPSPIAMQPL